MQFQSKILAGVALLALSSQALAATPLPVRSLAASCASCHGTNGVAQEGMESLAGQAKEDLLKKMLDFKTGKKPATIMHQLSKGYTDEQLEQLAAYFSMLKK
jgi:sulfide dehydrogenase cytochrome subunit